ncbi:MAG TPA: inorganic pyrophosphatase [Anaerolineaceae bacterium]|jgi:inorganic pyrophosphatase|nr:inorganic pyrophosphatase [Longilinea sp.]HNZ12788.1 inorganic pyrophosphatase [Anaerolineaceae bacterium]HOG78683.1 inorganic pyrophosphatase [Anaerolineaceae bacterium]HQF62873.1 inorganic pyrophosphatase [Anaerolineaceae bacterium]HQH84789.1 inorganic pyrophosphatase [Anaerolineaceae bacterium]
MSSFPHPFYRWRPHPWHGLEIGPKPPEIVHAYIEITPFDLVKYEVDKETGYLRVDRPQRSSSQPPTLYGIIPRTYCGVRVQRLSPQSQRGDGDPLDICVISERPITKSEVVLNARVIGGIQMIDNGEADDKIIAVLANDSFWDSAQDIENLPPVLVERLRHYFGTYKLTPGKENVTFIAGTYDRQAAYTVVEAAIADYEEAFGS